MVHPSKVMISIVKWIHQFQSCHKPKSIHQTAALATGILNKFAKLCPFDSKQIHSFGNKLLRKSSKREFTDGKINLIHPD